MAAHLATDLEMRRQRSRCWRFRSKYRPRALSSSLGKALSAAWAPNPISSHFSSSTSKVF